MKMFGTCVRCIKITAPILELLLYQRLSYHTLCFVFRQEIFRFFRLFNQVKPVISMELRAHRIFLQILRKRLSAMFASSVSMLIKSIRIIPDRLQAGSALAHSAAASRLTRRMLSSFDLRLFLAEDFPEFTSMTLSASVWSSLAVHCSPARPFDRAWPNRVSRRNCLQAPGLICFKEDVPGKRRAGEGRILPQIFIS